MGAAGNNEFVKVTTPSRLPAVAISNAGLIVNSVLSLDLHVPGVLYMSTTGAHKQITSPVVKWSRIGSIACTVVTSM